MEGTMGTERHVVSEMAPFGATMGTTGAVDSAMGSAHYPPSSSRHGDPFYLTSSAAPSLKLLDATAASNGGTEGATKDDAADDAVATRFGSIQLDSGGESEEGYSRAASSMKKKKKKSKKTAHAGSKRHQFVESDDDNDDNTVPRPNRGNVSKELHQLALVDLTTPLGEDEVMPRNEHYVVPERTVAGPSKSSHTRKKSKKKKSKVQKSLRTAVEGDLLGFDTMAFGHAAGAGNGVVANDGEGTAVESAVTSAPIDASNPINNAFDDLLGLEMPLRPMVEPLPNATSLLDPMAVTGTAFEEKPAPAKPKAKKQKKQKKEKKEKKKKPKKI